MVKAGITHMAKMSEEVSLSLVARLSLDHFSPDRDC